MKEYESGRWRDGVGQGTDEEAERRATLVTRLSRWSPGVLLDVGCGDGRFLDAARRLGWRTIGSEIAYSAASRVAADHLRFVGELDVVREEPFFDAITFWDVLEHLPDPAQAVKQAGLRVREGGLVAVTMPNLWGTASLLSGKRWSYYDFATCGHLHHFAPRHVLSLLRGAGFEVVFEETRGSVNLRDLPSLFGFATPRAPTRWFLDKASGALARVAEPLGLGNTLFIAARKVA